MKIDQYCQRQRCKNVELGRFWHAFASRGFVSDSWAFLLKQRDNEMFVSSAIYRARHMTPAQSVTADWYIVARHSYTVGLCSD